MLFGSKLVRDPKSDVRLKVSAENSKVLSNSLGSALRYGGTKPETSPANLRGEHKECGFVWEDQVRAWDQGSIQRERHPLHFLRVRLELLLNLHPVGIGQSSKKTQ